MFKSFPNSGRSSVHGTPASSNEFPKYGHSRRTCEAASTFFNLAFGQAACHLALKRCSRSRPETGRRSGRSQSQIVTSASIVLSSILRHRSTVST
jgi:hypothetical protein